MTSPEVDLEIPGSLLEGPVKDLSPTATQQILRLPKSQAPNIWLQVCRPLEEPAVKAEALSLWGAPAGCSNTKAPSTQYLKAFDSRNQSRSGPWNQKSQIAGA